MQRRLVVDRLLPGEPCEDFCYRFKNIGSLDQVFETEGDWNTWCQTNLAGNPYVTHECSMRGDGVLMWKHAQGHTAWYPNANLCLRLVACRGLAEKPLISTKQLTAKLTGI